MARSFFVWNGIDCRSKGIFLSGPVPIIRPEERVEHVQIPGRSGDLTEIEGTDVYNSYIQTASIIVRGGYRIREVYQWLRGSGYVTFGGEPDRRQNARIIGAITLNKHSYNLDWYTGEVQFYCQPFKQRLYDVTTTIAPGGSVLNAGDVVERPMFIITPTVSTVMIAAGGYSLTVTDVPGERIVVDSETKMVYTLSGATNLTANSVGQWPVLPTGSATISGSGWSTAEIQRRERFL